MKQILIDNLALIITTILGSGSAYGWFTERKKRGIEEKQIGADALKTMQDAYDRFTQDSSKKYDELKDEVTDLKKKLNGVTSQLESEKTNYSTLKLAHDKLKTAYDKLKAEFDAYKKKHSSE